MLKPRRSARDVRRDVPLTEAAMIGYARTLAQALKIDGAAHFDLRHIRPSQLGRIEEEARAILEPDAARMPAMEWLMDNARLVEARMRSLMELRQKPPLPAVNGTPRVQLLMRELVLHGDAQVDIARLTGVLNAFDEVQPLRLNELWAVPDALAVELCAAFMQVSEQVLSAQRDRVAAEEWVLLGARPEAIRAGYRSCTFYEHALMLMHEQEMPKSRRMLEEWLERHEAGAHTEIQLAHAEQALSRLWLSNIMGTLRMLDALDWLKCFEDLSRVEKELMKDPAGVYPRMDDESKGAVRNELAYLARASDLSEIIVARQAVSSAAREEDTKGSVCWWLYEDEGRQALLDALDAGGSVIRRITPDPDGAAYMSWTVLIALAFFALALEGGGNLFLALVSLPVCFAFSKLIINHVAARLVKPRMLLKLLVKQTPDDMRTLIVVPTLLSSPERASDVLSQMEALGCQQRDDNIDLLLLGDLRDSAGPEEPGDGEILAAAASEIKRMNARAGREKYFYLNRARSWCEGQKMYMGHERKRGALMALNRLLLCGQSEFDAEGASAIRIGKRGYRYVLSLDAGTWMLPGTAHKLIGAIAHPLNRRREQDGRLRGYSVLAPRMEQAQLGALTRFQLLMAGAGGVDSYPSCVSDIYQDLCGRGVFGGKGIYDVRAFSGALEGKLPDGAILSHDLLEGLMAGAGTLCDVALYDEFPRTPEGYFGRMNRWTRGDWQLLPFIGRRMGLGRFENYLMIDNLRRSLTPVAALLLLIFGAWTFNPAALLMGLVFPFAPALLSLPRADKAAWISCGLRLTLLPVEAWQCADAVIRTLHRLYISHSLLLSWVTAADAEKLKSGQSIQLPGRVAALLLLPALVHPELILLLIGLGALFLTPAMQLRQDEAAPPFDEAQLLLLDHLARDTWRFFETQVPVGGTGLPPDNLQVSPPVGAARRTSPTNIGLYLTSCVAAQRMGMLEWSHMLTRLEQTTATIEALDKWHGQLYNWYDIDTLQPLTPRYVSAVDGGNLAACLMACAAALTRDARPKAQKLAQRMDALCHEMEFEKLYDEQRKLFVIGADVERDKLSSAHYDLLASESRILSFVAMALGKVPAKHWAHLGRALSDSKKGRALISWSGTMFEYLMPELLLRAPANSLLGETNKTVVRNHIARADDFVWGVSESGYNAFDLQMNYQYRAFGLPQLSLRGESYEQVIAPYATLLALPVMPKSAARNLQKMKTLGFFGEFGLYEAIDCVPERLIQGEGFHVVKSFMSHHQGMMLCALWNALRDDELVKLFMGRPEVRALQLLLCEKRPARAHVRRRREAQRSQPNRSQPGARMARRGEPLSLLPDAHLLYGGGGTSLLSANGQGFLRVNGVMANRWQLNTEGEEDGLFVHARLIGRGTKLVINGPGALDKKSTRRVSFDAGSASWIVHANDLEMRLNQCVSPEDGALVQQIVLSNHGQKAAKLELTSCFKVALQAQGDMRAHPVFQNLFVESAPAGEAALVFRRRPRDEKHCPMLAHLVFGAEGQAVSRESDLVQLTGRDGSVARAGGIAKKLSETTGRVLDPCSALRVKVVVEPGERRELGFAIGIAEDEDSVKKLIKRYQTSGAARRAQMLAQTQARAMLDFLRMNPARHHALQRASAFLHWHNLKFLEGEPAASLSISGLWALGVSGDLPILSVFISGKDQLELARDAVRAHEFYRAMGVWCDLLLINEYGNNYEQPVRDSLREIVSASHLRELVNEPGGAFLIEGSSLLPAQRALIRTASSIVLIGGEGSLLAQINRRLSQQQMIEEQPHAFPMEDRPLPPVKTRQSNGWGGFAADAGKYLIELAPGKPTPAPWCNIMSNPCFGTLVSERGGGFSWYGNSRFGRLTPFVNDPVHEGFSERLFLVEEGRRLSLLPGPETVKSRFRVTHTQGLTRFESASGGLSWVLNVFVDPERPIKCMALSVKNEGEQARVIEPVAEVDFLMGASLEEMRLTSTSRETGMVFARGAMEGVGFLALPGSETRIRPYETLHFEALLGWATDAIEARALISSWRQEGGAKAALVRATSAWTERFCALQVSLPDPMMQAMLNKWLPYQALSARFFGRTGLYQAGGAFGFRDQLQDMLCLIPLQPEMARRHLLLSAQHQFVEGDVMHWWHPERTGVRTRISDDLLFLPYVTAEYVLETGDSTVLSERIPYLEAEELPEGTHDCYQTPPLSETSETLHQHCIRAIDRASRFGAHDLPLMGTGDWNDGMDRVGVEGRGESVWLAEFLAVVAREYAQLCEGEERDRLQQLSARMLRAVETSGWDGRWYRRAYYDDGTPIGSADGPKSEGCRIDAIAQSWAVMAGVDRGRQLCAMEQVWQQLVDQKQGIIRLLTPPFDEPRKNPGYIASYPPGVRENGGQYTHGACWVVMAYAQLGQAERAWQALEMLMPYSHAQSEQQAERYKVEPYVVAADVYSDQGYAGRGGWTWYTGAAGWLWRVAVKYLLGYERRGERVRMAALLPQKWTEARIVLSVGKSKYTLVSSRRASAVTLDGQSVEGEDIALIDDESPHEAVFPARVAVDALQSEGYNKE